MTAIGTRAIDLVRRSGVEHQVHAYEPAARHGRDRDARPSYGREAAAALGIDPGRIFKTLVASVDGRLVLAVVPVDRELDLEGAGRRRPAGAGRRWPTRSPRSGRPVTSSAGSARSATRRALPVVLDAQRAAQPTVFVSAGRRGLQLELAPADLVALTGAIVAPVARDH